MTGQSSAKSSWIAVAIARVIVIVTVLGLWEFAAHTGLVDPALIGQPSGIAKSLADGLFQGGDLIKELGWTLASTLIAFVLGAAAAIAVGMLFVLLPTVETVLDPFLSALNSMPRIALAPMLIVWFGLGVGSKIAIGFSLVFFIVLQSTIAGGRNINADHVTLSRTLGLKPAALFWSVTMPSAVPVMFAGLRLGLVASLLGVVGGEIIASEHGLGQRVAYLANSFDMNGVWSVLVLLALVGMVLTWSLDKLEMHLLRWR
nr:C555 [uncultured bacterium]